MIPRRRAATELPCSMKEFMSRSVAEITSQPDHAALKI